MSGKRMTPQLADRQRRANTMWAVSHRVEIRGIVGRLRTHARRAKSERGYNTLDGQTRRDYADTMGSIASKLEDRMRLRLSMQWWLDKALRVLLIADMENPI